MHELSFAQQVLETVLEAASGHAPCQVTRIRLRVSESLALEPDSLRFCLDAIAVNTPAEGASVEIEEAGPEVVCAACGPRTVSSPLDATCPACGGPATPHVRPELIIMEIELDEQDDTA